MDLAESIEFVIRELRATPGIRQILIETEELDVGRKDVTDAGQSSGLIDQLRAIKTLESLRLVFSGILPVAAAPSLADVPRAIQAARREAGLSDLSVRLLCTGYHCVADKCGYTAVAHL